MKNHSRCERFTSEEIRFMKNRARYCHQMLMASQGKVIESKVVIEPLVSDGSLEVIISKWPKEDAAHQMALELQRFRKDQRERMK